MKVVALLKQKMLGFPQKLRGKEMAIIQCPECGGRVSLETTPLHGTTRGMVIRGSVTCDHWDNDKYRKSQPHEWPITLDIKNNAVVTEVNVRLPAIASDKLVNVPGGLVEDIQEAEKTHFARCYKASVVMCRRAVQLALEQHLGIIDQTLGPLLKAERNRKPHLLGELNYQLAERIKDYGDQGAHRTGTLNPKTVETVIHDTVEVLNELYK